METQCNTQSFTHVFCYSHTNIISDCGSVIIIVSVYCFNRKVFSCVLKVSTETSVDHSAAGRLFHVDGPQTAKRNRST